MSLRPRLIVLTTSALLLGGTPSPEPSPQAPPPQLESIWDIIKDIIWPPPPSGPTIGKPDPSMGEEVVPENSRWRFRSPLSSSAVPGTYSMASVPVRFDAVPGASRYTVTLSGPTDQRVQSQVAANSSGRVSLNLTWPEPTTPDCWTPLGVWVSVSALDASGACVVSSAPYKVQLFPESCVQATRESWRKRSEATCAGARDEASGVSCAVVRGLTEAKFAVEGRRYYAEAERLSREVDAQLGVARYGAAFDTQPGRKVAERGCAGVPEVR